MKKTLLVVFFAAYSIVAKAQKTDSTQTPADSVIRSMEQVPEFPGGTELFYRFLMTHINYPQHSREMCKRGSTPQNSGIYNVHKSWISFS